MSDTHDNVILFPVRNLTRARLIQHCRDAILAHAQGRGQMIAREQLDAIDRIVGSVYDDHMAPYDLFQRQMPREDELPTDTGELMALNVKLIHRAVEAYDLMISTMFVEIVTTRLRSEGRL